MDRQLVLEDNDGQVVRTYAWNGKPVQVVRRGDTRRLELVDSFDEFDAEQIPYEHIGNLTDKVERFPIGKSGHLRVLPKVEIVAKDIHEEDETNTFWYITVAIIMLLAGGALTFLLTRTPDMEKVEEAAKQTLIKIVKAAPPRPKVVEASHVSNQKQEEVKPNSKPKAIDRLKRMGALGALGSLSKSKQMGGLDLAKANTTAGPGLGGNAGSGGTQTSLYAKGLTSAPLGAGNRVEGAGGYGTKGKGGGQAGYGKMTMVGSTGAAPIGLSQEATMDTGLDRDAIIAVINRNMGQVRFCYEQGLQADPNLNGRVAIDFVIGGNGAVKTASVANSSLNSKTIEDCISMRLKSWKFPLPAGGVDVKVVFPFVLRRTGQG